VLLMLLSLGHKLVGAELHGLSKLETCKGKEMEEWVDEEEEREKLQQQQEEGEERGEHEASWKSATQTMIDGSSQHAKSTKHSTHPRFWPLGC
jgi:hypothetical protein